MICAASAVDLFDRRRQFLGRRGQLPRRSWKFGRVLQFVGQRGQCLRALLALVPTPESAARRSCEAPPAAAALLLRRRRDHFRCPSAPRGRQRSASTPRARSRRPPAITSDLSPRICSSASDGLLPFTFPRSSAVGCGLDHRCYHLTCVLDLARQVLRLRARSFPTVSASVRTSSATTAKPRP